MLLVRFLASRRGRDFEFWATPGGRVEPGESDQAAAQRELREELGLSLVLQGPLFEVASVFEEAGRAVQAVDVFFMATCDPGSPRLCAADGAEREAMREIRWWSLEELEGSRARIFPENLSSLLGSRPSRL